MKNIKKKSDKKVKKKKTNLQKFIRKSTDKVGLPPGTLVHVGRYKLDKVGIEIFNYNKDSLIEKKIDILNTEEFSVDKYFPTLVNSNLMWVNMEGVHRSDIIRELGKFIDHNMLVLEDILNTTQRAKAEIYDGYIFLVLKMLSYNENNDEVEDEQVSFILGKNFVFSIQEGKEGDVFNPIRDILRKENSVIRKNSSDFLLYFLLDVIIDNYFIIIEKLGEKIEILEDELINKPTSITLNKIYSLRREILFVRKCVWPLREAITAISRDETLLIHKKTEGYFRNIYDHLLQIADTIETLRDMVTVMSEIYMSHLNTKMNEVMKVLTLIGTIFIPLTFIAGVYGMNFEYMPELKSPYGYPVALIGMSFIGLFMLVFFKLKKWI